MRTYRGDFAVLRRKPEPHEIEARLRALGVPEANIRRHVDGLAKASKPERKRISDSDFWVDYAGGFKRKLSPEHRAKIGASKKGKKRTEAVRAKISASKKGTVCTWRDKIRASIRAAHDNGTISEDNLHRMRTAWLGRRHTAETKAKLSAAAKENWTRSDHRAAHAAAMTPEVRHAFGSGRRGRKVSDQTRARMSAGLKRAHANNPVWVRSKRDTSRDESGATTRKGPCMKG